MCTQVFNALADAICSCQRLATNAKFVIVPGPNDVGNNFSLPRRGIPLKLVDGLMKRVSHVSIGSNPCRIKFFTQEIVIFREDLIQKMQRHTAVAPNINEQAPEIAEQAVSVIIDQAHLCPLPFHARPIIWGLDHSLHLTPLPHLIVLGDRTTSKFEIDRSGSTVTNPGSFAVDSTFVVYRPATRDVEFSKIH